MTSSSGLSDPDIQAQLILDALQSATVGFLVWDEERRYIAANDAACRILGCTRDELLGSAVGAHTQAAGPAIEEAIDGGNTFGSAVVQRFDGSGSVDVVFATFTTRTAGLPWMATVIWPAAESRELVLRKESGAAAS